MSLLCFGCAREWPLWAAILCYGMCSWVTVGTDSNSSLTIPFQIKQFHCNTLISDGEAYGWGRNESGQLGLGYSSPCVPFPTLLSIDPKSSSVKFVSAGVGKTHTLLVTEEGTVYASGGNKCGQLGVNNEKLEGCDRFRKCVVVDYAGDEEEGVKIIHVSSLKGYCDNKLELKLTFHSTKCIFKGLMWRKHLGSSLLYWSPLHRWILRVGSTRQW